MASGGFLDLAYMSELAFVVNLAYLELPSHRYIKGARDSVSESLKKLIDSNENQNDGPVKGTEQFFELYSQAKSIFHTDKNTRRGNWYVLRDLNPDNKQWFTGRAGWIYEIFVNGRDKWVATILLVIAGFVVVLITILDWYLTEISTFNSTAMLFTWWSLFAILMAGILVPTFFVVCGRLLSAAVEKISKNIEDRKDKLAASIIAKKIHSAE
jgi:hypothetical protein